MTGSRFLRPLPLSVAILFLAVAAVDVIHNLVQEPPPMPRLLESNTVRFVMTEPLLDLRAAEEPLDVEVQPGGEFDSSWSRPGRGGRWIEDSAASLRIDLARGGHRGLIIEARAPNRATSARRIAVRVNGTPCGDLEFGPRWERLVVAVPEGLTMAGENEIVLERADGPDGRPRGRALLVRRLALVLETADAAPLQLARSPVAIGGKGDRIILATSGALELVFHMDERIDALTLRYRFTSRESRARVVVRRPDGVGAGYDSPARRRLDAAEEGSGRVRIPMHGRRGEFLLRVVVEPGRYPQRLDLWPELVTE